MVWKKDKKTDYLGAHIRKLRALRFVFALLTTGSGRNERKRMFILEQRVQKLSACLVFACKECVSSRRVNGMAVSK